MTENTMSWLPSNTSLSISLRGKPTNILTLDIHPSRLRMRAGCSLEDLVMGLVAMYHQPPISNVLARQFWTSNALGGARSGAALDYPDGGIEEGGFFLHSGSPLPEMRTITATPTQLHLCDGRVFDRATFNPPHPAGSVQNRLARIMVREPFGKTRRARYRVPVMGLMLGAMGALDGYPINNWRKDTDPTILARHVVALASPLHRDINRTGSSLDNVLDFVAELGPLFVQSWMLRPNRGWAPEYWMRGKDFLDFAQAHALAEDVAAGEAGARVLLDHGLTPDQIRVLGEEGSAHHRLNAHAIQEQVITAILNSYEDTLLVKPARLKKRDLLSNRA